MILSQLSSKGKVFLINYKMVRKDFNNPSNFNNFAVLRLKYQIENIGPMARKKQDIILENVVIEAVAAEGKALAKIDGAVLFVQFAVPGDVVDVKVTKKKKNYMEGFILRMVKPSEHRLEPF